MTESSAVQYLSREGKPSLAYRKIDGENKPTVMFLGGFRSDMMGTKADFLEQKCAELQLPYIRFDYRGHGQSEGDFEDSCIGEWAQDALDILDEQTAGKVILIGSSMGGWISLLLTLKRPERLHALIGLAAAPDFTQWMEEKMSAEQHQSVAEKGYFELPNDYDDAPYIITKKLLDDGRENSVLDKGIHITCPVHLIQGMKDADVPWQTAHRIKEAMTGTAAEVILLENADHRLSKPDELEMLFQSMKELAA